LAEQEVEILSVANITAQQIIDSSLAIPAFLPATVCTGYSTAWFTNLHNFRQRSLVERLFWSLPLSFAVTPIASYLIGKYLSLTAVVVFLLATVVICAATLIWEVRQIRRTHGKWNIGWHPLGGKALALAIVWMALTVLSLVDIQSGHKLFVSVAMLDQSYRVNWIESVLHTGVPPANPLYMYLRPAPMRNYYFLYVICAAIAKGSHLPVRAICTASCVWAGLALAALIGLYLKHFLAVGPRLRRQFLTATCLLTVSGLDICVVFWDLFHSHITPQAEIDFWSTDPVFSWLNNLLWSPNHIASLVCCTLALLLAWIAGQNGSRNRTTSIVFIACALSSAFGLSIFVTFAFFLVMMAWAFWQLAFERSTPPVLLLAAGGGSSLVLLIPFLLEITHGSSGIEGGSPFSFAVREMIPPNSLLASSIFHRLATIHPLAAFNLAKMLLLVPGYTLEFGFYLVVFLIYLVPAWRQRVRLTPAQRSLVFIALATLPFVSFIRSGVLKSNDFVWRGSLLVQFSLLLLGSELLCSWNLPDRNQREAAAHPAPANRTPHWLRSIAALALVIGATSTLCEGLMLRFATALGEWHASGTYEPGTRSYSHNAYLSSIGYTQLNATIPDNAVVQFNANHQQPFWMTSDGVNVDRQIAIVSDRPWCGSEIGGDPRPCPAMAAAIDALYDGVSAEQARATCHQYGIQYLIARIYDPAWSDKNGWVWTLKPVVSQNEFRALDCGL
jgi:hypothetical protein